jgi:uncharacterized protein
MKAQIKFLTEGALLFGKNLVIGDLHLGIEYEFAQQGVTIPTQTKKVQSRIDKLIEQTKAKHLIFIGDVRHKIPLPSKQEQQELPGFFNHFLRSVEVSVVKGNHDGGIESLLPKKVNVYSSSGFVIGNICLTHGQAHPVEGSYDTIVIGHLHPNIEFFSEGIRMSEAVWMKTTIGEKKLIVMPAFNHLLGGYSINQKNYKKLGPLLKKADFDNADVFLLDGTLIGKLKDLRNTESE